MKTDVSPHVSGSELRAFASFYGAAIMSAVVLHALAASLLPAELVAGHNAFIWTLSFLLGCAGCAWMFERHRKLHLH